MKNIQLRRGNNVYHNEELKTIDCIAPGHVILLEDRIMIDSEEALGQWVDLDNIEFIPLTISELLKLGFSEFGSPDRYQISFENNKSFMVSFAECRNVWTWQGVELKHVHQLQNLIFAILQEEISYETN